ncbi:MAG: lytic transglycosylase domain-containing protein [Brevefilum sp.]|nr:lytic transglycosylase domain-containing protein [Brevefilum sp.]
MRRIIVIPAVVVGCLIVIWVGTVAAAQMPPQGLLAPTLTASAQSGQTNNETLLVTDPIASQNLEDPASDCSLPSSYPPSIQQWCQSIELSAQQVGLPATLIAAVVLQESGGDPLAYSSSGAVGLMQVMPRDGQAADFMCINGPCFASRPTMAELQDPDFNLAYGSRMLANLYAKHGTYREALFRYGPMDMGYRYADLVLKIWENYQ